MEESRIRELIRAACKARKMSYSPYSHFSVGAALLTMDGLIYTGCNVENAAYGPTNCAERTAFFKAVSEGDRKFSAIAIVGSPLGDPVQYAYPCGVCRQVMMEFCDPQKFIVITAVSESDYQIATLSELLPHGFSPADVRQDES